MRGAEAYNQIASFRKSQIQTCSFPPNIALFFQVCGITNNEVKIKSSITYPHESIPRHPRFMKVPFVVDLQHRKMLENRFFPLRLTGKKIHV